MVKVQTCKCGVQFAQRINQKTGLAGPIETEPSADGNCAVIPETGEYTIIPAHERSSFPQPLYKNHFATCPNRAEFGRKKRGL